MSTQRFSLCCQLSLIILICYTVFVVCCKSDNIKRLWMPISQKRYIHTLVNSKYSVIKKYHWVMYLNFIILARLILFLIGITEPRIKVHFCLLLSSNCARAVLLEILQSSISRKKIILFMQNHYPSPIGFCNLAAVVTFIIMT